VINLTNLLINCDLVIFDLDGTLIDSHQLISRTLVELTQEWDLATRPIDYYSHLIGLPLEKIVENERIPVGRTEEFIQEFRNRLGIKIVNETKVFLGVIDFLNLLESRSKDIAIATSKPSELAKLTLDSCGLSKFKFYIQGTDGFPAKPNPEVVLRCLGKFRTTSAIMIGDRVEDIQAASAAGISSIGMALGYHTEQDLLDVGATFVVPNWIKLLEAFH
jgi:phosphoglycolate phosphatase